MMNVPIGTILQHTPVWVFVVLAAVIVLGLQALRPRELPVWRLLAVPAVFIGWGILSLIQRSLTSPALAAEWFAAVALGAAIGWAVTRLAGVTFDPSGGFVHVPGTPLTLVRNLLIFLVRYGIAVAAALSVTAAGHAQFVTLDVAVSGIVAGYFLGWIGRFARARRASAVPQGLPVASA